jgi:hypothetical protein
MLEEGVGRALPGLYFGWVTVRHENPNRFACGSWIGVIIASRPSRRQASGTYFAGGVAPAWFAGRLGPSPAVRRERRCFREAQREIVLHNIDCRDVDLDSFTTSRNHVAASSPWRRAIRYGK